MVPLLVRMCVLRPTTKVFQSAVVLLNRLVSTHSHRARILTLLVGQHNVVNVLCELVCDNTDERTITASMEVLAQALTTADGLAALCKPNTLDLFVRIVSQPMPTPTAAHSIAALALRVCQIDALRDPLVMCDGGRPTIKVVVMMFSKRKLGACVW